MLIKKKRAYDLPESAVTDHALYLSRRQFIRSAGLVGAGAALAGCRPAQPADPLASVQQVAPTSAPTTSVADTAAGSAASETAVETDAAAPSIATTDELGNALTAYDDVTGYNNYYEFTTTKERVRDLAKDFTISPWQIEIGGMVNNPGTYDLQDILKQVTLEDRIYRMRCVEAWSMVIPWTGFQLADLLKIADPQSDAKYVAFETAFNKEEMPGVGGVFGGGYDWPYKEGLRVDEAMNELTMMATGLYGEDLLPQNGAPVRLVVPWKYGFKSIKSIVKITLVDEQPPTLWNTANGREYGFYSNVNPEVNHPRWSQATERRIGVGRVQTLKFNGYEEQVAALYDGMDLTVNF